MKVVYEEIYTTLLDDIFHEHSKIPRSEFIAKLAGEHSKYLDSNHIKTLVLVKQEEKGMKDLSIFGTKLQEIGDEIAEGQEAKEGEHA